MTPEGSTPTIEINWTEDDKDDEITAVFEPPTARMPVPEVFRAAIEVAREHQRRSYTPDRHQAITDLRMELRRLGAA